MSLDVPSNMKIQEISETYADVVFSDFYKLKLSSKKLRSGKCQVKFHARVRDRRDLHGYVLVEANQTLKNVVSQIKERLWTIHQTNDFHHIHLYSIGKHDQKDISFIFFES